MCGISPQCKCFGLGFIIEISVPVIDRCDYRISIGYCKTDTIKFSKHIQNCLKELEEEMEYETDVDIVNIVRIQYLTNRIIDLRERDEELDSLGGLPINPIPKETYISAYQSELNLIEDRLPLRLKMDSKISCHAS